MKLEQAIEIVLELARENILTEGDARDNGLEDERNKQFDACGTVEDFAVNILAEERVNFPEEQQI
tara:strand:+ start:357 stop:551 length:195 start_codon:yes stop_codon:yes gene_type:complete